MMDPNHFLMIMLSRFELYHIFSSADCRKRYSRENANKVCLPPNHFLSPFLFSLLDFSLLALISIASDVFLSLSLRMWFSRITH